MLSVLSIPDGNLGGWVGPYMMGFIKTETGSFDLGYFAYGIIYVNRRYNNYSQSNMVGQVKKISQPVTENTITDTVANLNNSNKKTYYLFMDNTFFL